MDLDGIAGELEATQESRDSLLTQSRRAISLCGRAIISVHRGRHAEAAEALGEAEARLRAMQAAALPKTAQYLIPAEQEYTEARAFLAVAARGEVPGASSLGVQPESYVLGLMDAIGEMKRLMLDQIRADDADAARRTFQTMEDLYTDLYRFAAYDKVLRESRRKLDVARTLLESCRSTITEEGRRQDMVQKMRAMGFEPTNS